jgi:hypothetical protein
MVCWLLACVFSAAVEVLAAGYKQQVFPITFEGIDAQGNVLTSGAACTMAVGEVSLAKIKGMAYMLERNKVRVTIAVYASIRARSSYYNLAVVAHGANPVVLADSVFGLAFFARWRIAVDSVPLIMHGLAVVSSLLLVVYCRRLGKPKIERKKMT